MNGEMCLLDLTCSSVQEDIALDEALLIASDASDGPEVLRFWEPREFAVVLGASRSIRADVLADSCGADGVPVLRRSSGGGTVVVGPGVLNVAVILPENRAPGLWAVAQLIDTFWNRLLNRSCRPANRLQSTARATSWSRAASVAAVPSGGSNIGSWCIARFSIRCRSSGLRLSCGSRTAAGLSPRPKPSGFLEQLAAPSPGLAGGDPRELVSGLGTCASSSSRSVVGFRNCCLRNSGNRSWIERF